MSSQHTLANPYETHLSKTTTTATTTTTTTTTITTTKFNNMEDFDRISARVTVCGAFGALAGVGTAMYKGHPMARTVGLTALSCAMVGSACFTSERLCAIAMRGGPLEQELGRSSFSVLTHTCGGFCSGGLLGALYIGKPIHGVVFFVPLMAGVGYAESLFQDLLDERRSLLFQRKNQS